MASADRQMIGDATLAPQGFRPGVVVSSVAQRLWLDYRAGIGFTPAHTPHHRTPACMTATPPHPAPEPAADPPAPPPPAAQPVTLHPLRLAHPLRSLLQGLPGMRAAPPHSPLFYLFLF